MKQPTTEPKPELLFWRGSVIYTGKLSGQTNTVFIRASTRDKATKFIGQRVRKFHKGKSTEGCEFRVFTTASCESEMRFFEANQSIRGYDGIVN